MKIKRLKMSSFRGIGDLTLKFDETEPTVLIGVNGVGKSSILDCLAILLSHIPSEIKLSERWVFALDDSLTPFNERDITNGHNETHNEIVVSFTDLQEAVWSLTQSRKSRNRSIHALDNFEPVPEELLDYLDMTDQLADSETNLPLAVYYPVNRAVLDFPLKVSEKLFEQVDAYYGALAGVSVSFESFFQWFKAQEDMENELRLDNPAHRNRQLEAVRQAISTLMPGFSDLRVRRSPMRMTVMKQGQELIINQLSGGEKGLLALAGDLARRLAIANPVLSNPLHGNSVVLIDEIELHLHPAWQRGIIPALTRTFPNCQFIITTHSPQVISDVKPNGIYILMQTPEGIIAKRPESSFGRDSNRILDDLMGVPERPQEIKDHLRALFRLIDNGQLTEAKQLQRQIEDQIGDDEPEFASADILIRRREISKPQFAVPPSGQNN